VGTVGTTYYQNHEARDQCIQRRSIRHRIHLPSN